MTRAALIAGISVAALLCVGSSPSSARTFSIDSFWARGTPVTSDSPSRKSGKHALRSETKPARVEKTPAPPSGQLHIIVSIDTQRATLYSDGVPVASTPVSTGTPGHPTPMGVFTVIQKDRNHVSNLYDAAMPYMQRITWSGSALHQGPLPGYPASHGCVRLTTEFAQLLWRTTKLGARVIVTRPNVAPEAFSSPWLAALKPTPAEKPQPQAMEPAVTSSVIKTADASAATALPSAHQEMPAPHRESAPSSRQDTTPLQPDMAGNSGADQPTKLVTTDGAGAAAKTAEAAPVEAKPADTHPVEAADAKPAEVTPPKAAEAAKPMQIAAPPSLIVGDKPATSPAPVVREVKHKPISVFISLKEQKLYVRQGWEPLFSVPVTVEHPEQPIGTHVYTAMGLKPDGDFRWTVVTIPSNYKRGSEPKHVEHARRKGREIVVEEKPALPSASAALERIVLPADVASRISEMMMTGSSVIVSDNKLSDETDNSTDFIVLTPALYARN